MKRKNIVKIIILLIIYNIICIIINHYFNFESTIKYNTIINKNNIENRVGYLEINKIKFKKDIYDINSSYNNVNKNIEIISNDLNNIIIAGHSGNNKNAFFKELKYLKLNDIIKLNYNNNDLLYMIKNIYEIDKNGNAEIIKDDSKTLILITCNEIDRTKQIVYVSELIADYI